MVIVDAVLVGISWFVGWPLVDGTTLFWLGIAMLVIGYLLDSLLFGKYQFRGGRAHTGGFGTYVYRPNSEEAISFDQYKTEEGNIKESELVRARRQSDILLNVNFAGAIAIVLSFIIPHLF